MGIPLSDDWVLVDDSDNTQTFVNKKTIQINGNTRSALAADNYREYQEVNEGGKTIIYKSGEIKFVVLCRKKQIALASGRLYSENYMKGNLALSLEFSNEYGKISSGSKSEAFYKYVCSQ